LSNAMRKGKRVLAGVSAAALGLALVPFIATPAFAATSLTSVTLDGPVRAGSFTQTAAIVGVDLDVATQKFFVVPNGSNPAALTVNTVDDTITSATAGTIKLSNATTAGTYSVRVCVVATAASNCNAPVTFRDFSFTTTGAPTTVAVTPATQNSVPTVTQTYTVTIRDSANNVTQLNSSNESVVVTGSSTAGTATIVQSSLNASLASEGTGTFTATNSAAGTTTLTATPSGAFFGSPATATLVTNPVVVDDTVTLTAPVSTGNNTIKTGTTALTFQLQRGADDTGTYFDYAVSGTAVAASSGLLLVGANGTATLNVTVTDDSAINNNTVIVTAGTGTLTVTYANPAPILQASSPVIVTSPGTTLNLTGQLTDQWGDPISGYIVVGAATAGTDAGTATSNGSTNAQGNYSVTFLGPTAQDDSTTTVRVQAYSPTAPSTTYDDSVDIYYTASGTVDLTGLTLGNNRVIDDSFASTVQVPFGGTAATAVTGASGSTGNVVPVRVATAGSIPAQITYTVTGGSLSTTASTAWDAGSSSVTASADDTVYLFSTSVGTARVTATAGGNSLSGNVPITTAAAAAYNIALTPMEQSVAPGGIGTVTLMVSDVFGNPVQTDDSGLVRISASGEVLLAGFTTSSTFVTNSSGEAVVTFIAGGAIGQGILTATPAATTPVAAWAPNYTPPTNAPAPVTSAAAEIGVGQSPIEPLILIEGTRENRRISIEGATLGLAEGTEVYPFIRFPGQTGFTQGTAVRTVTIVDEDEQIGEFAWGRNTGKRTAVQFRDADGLRSNTVIIAAR
jgi:hypothetical protein